MARKVCIKAPSPRVIANIQLDKKYFDLQDLTRVDFVVYHQLAIAAHLDHPRHHKVLAREVGYGRSAVLKSLAKLIEEGLVVKLGGGLYKMKQVRGGFPAKKWELEVLSACSFEQLSVWRFIKKNEGLAARPKSLASKVGISPAQLAKAVHDQKIGSGLVPLGIILRNGARWFTPTGFTRSGPAGGIPGGATRALTRARSSVEENKSLSSLLSSIKLRVSRVVVSVKAITHGIYMSLSALGAERQGREGGVQSDFVRENYPRMKFKTWDEVFQGPNGRKYDDRLFEEVRGEWNPKKYLMKFLWTSQIPEKYIDQLLSEFHWVKSNVLIHALRKAFKWIDDLKKYDYNKPYHFVLKWLRSSRNLEVAAFNAKVADYKREEPPTEVKIFMEERDEYYRGYNGWADISNRWWNPTQTPESCR